MAKLLKLRRGTNTQHSSFTGAEGEVTVNTTNDSLHVHDGTTAGGRELMRADKNNMPTSGVTAGTYGSSSAIPAITVDAKGLVTSATTNAIDSTSITNGTSNVSVASGGDITATRAGTTRLTVNSTGIDVTGTVTCDGLTVDGGITTLNGGAYGQLVIKDNGNSGASSQASLTLQDSVGDDLSRFGQLSTSSNDCYIDASPASATIRFQTQGNSRAQITSGGFQPSVNNAYDLGTSGLQWRNGYFDGRVYCDGLTSEGDILIEAGSGVITLKDSNNTGDAVTAYLEGKDSANTALFQFGQITSGNDQLYIKNLRNDSIVFSTNGSDRGKFDNAGHFIPVANNTYDLGSSSLRWRNVYTNDLNLSNEGGTNDVDGTWGSWTIQEGEDDLFLLNRRNGKKYKFNLSEVN